MHSAWGWHSLAVLHECALLVWGGALFCKTTYGTCTHIYTPHAYTYTHLYTFHTHSCTHMCLVWHACGRMDKYPTKPCLPYLHTHTHAQETWEKRVSYIQVVVELVGAASHQKKTHIHSYSDPISHLFQTAVDVCVFGMWIHIYMHTSVWVSFCRPYIVCGLSAL